MNIFAVDTDPARAAQALCDRHVVKMALETAQILCTVVQRHGGSAPYKATHAGHPCVQWAGATRGNAEWLADHGGALCDEYTRRYRKTHASADVLASLDLRCVPRGALQKHVQCMPEQYQRADAVEACRAYYRGDKARTARWANGREPPEWWQQAELGGGTVVEMKNHRRVSE